MKHVPAPPAPLAASPLVRRPVAYAAGGAEQCGGRTSARSDLNQRDCVKAGRNARGVRHRRCRARRRQYPAGSRDCAAGRHDRGNSPAKWLRELGKVDAEMRALGEVIQQGVDPLVENHEQSLAALARRVAEAQASWLEVRTDLNRAKLCSVKSATAG